MYRPRMPIRTRLTAWRTLAMAATAALTAALLTPAVAHSAPRESRPVYSYDNAIREAVWVDTGLDGDSDGRTDRVAVDIVRPREPAAQGRKIPVIMDASPYYSCCGRGNESQRKTYDANGNVVQMPLFYDNYFVPRGYAFVAVDLAGTNRSDGCVDVGGRSDVQSAQGRRRLAERPRHGLHQPHGHRPREGDLDQRQDRHDRQELRRHHRQRRRRHRRRGPEDHRPDQRHLLLVRLLLRQGRPPLRLRPRMAVRLRREPGAPAPSAPPYSRRSSTVPLAPATGHPSGPSATTRRTPAR